jgi:SAM-dependent methyltransferase
METTKRAIRDSYGKIARDRGQSSCCSPSCCTPEADGASPGPSPTETSQRLGYSADDLDAVPEGANLGLGCGNPQAIASLRAGEAVLDLGSGGGFDCFLAARAVGETGKVIGVDMTADMISLARENAAKSDLGNVEFRLGEIEHLPIADASVDVIMSNCVINLSPDKPAVFREAFRVLRPGGRLAISDVVATAPLPERLRKDLGAIAACIGGAAHIDEVEAMLADAGFEDIEISPKDESREIIREWQPGQGLDELVISATIQARRPA